MPQRAEIATAMIGVGLLALAALLGLRLVWMLARFRGVAVFCILVGVVAAASFTRAATEAAPAPPTPESSLAQGCTEVNLSVEGCTSAIESGLWSDAQLAWAFNNRGLSYAAKGALLDALRDYGRAIELAPDHPAAWMNRGNAHAVLGDLLAALADHNKALELAPENASVWHNRGVTHEELGEHENALADYRKAIELDPTHRGSHIGLATANCKLSRVKASSAARLRLVEQGLVPAVEMQEILQREGFYRGPIDGIFGKGSRAALRAWTRKGCLAHA
ncbi:MAG: tetratricopeptide repeat protein [Pseudomonadota bacterium]